MITPTQWRTLAVPAVVCALAMWLVLRFVYALLPPLPWTGVPALALLAVAEGWIGRSVRARLRGGHHGEPIHPLAVARMVALAKASSLAAAIIGGLAAGFLGYVAASLSRSVYRADAFTSGATLVAAAVLAAAALYLEYGCRVPPASHEPAEPSHTDGHLP